MRGLPTLPPSLPPSQFTDDVLSHLFLSTAYSPISSSTSTSSSATDPLTVHLLPNPSHLETVTPVALGFARGLQVPLGSLKAEGAAGEKEPPYELGTKVLSLAIHGDAAFGGQGVVAETFNLASLPHFNAGGTIHLVVNNQLGYTTPVSPVTPVAVVSPADLVARCRDCGLFCGTPTGGPESLLVLRDRSRQDGLGSDSARQR